MNNFKITAPAGYEAGKELKIEQRRPASIILVILTAAATAEALLIWAAALGIL